MKEIEKAIQWFEESLVGSMALRDYELTNICKTSLAALREKLERQQNDPLTLEELREMDGEPVWVDDWFMDTHCWELSEDAEDYFEGRNESQYGSAWLAYRHKPEEEEHD